MKFGYTLWLPETETVSTFVENLKNAKLMGTRCKNCGAKYLPPRGQCRCGSSEMEWFEAPSQGKILTYTLIKYPPETMSKYAPYTVAVAELADGSRILAQLTGVSPKTLKVGMRIEAVSHLVSEDRVVYEFRPA